ncbi:hypothetical protein [Olleya sp. HaHaR_3_96]|uniref:hypothetical protein n=1 Tax=Olleya sp. HaHaR_3_96 TaxID=2745560 RepID=UPI001C4E5774|nr:hypothetical protein [Olleya sp. HaHaR_3_96]QXP60804.1 hypothetical protein H0I26_03970 [Olleya sp. HaHaR_3_96]
MAIKNYYILLIVFFLIKVSTVSGQTLKGTITDKNNIPISVANILIKKDSLTISEYTLPSAGVYEISLKKDYLDKIIIEVDAYGYKKQQKIITNPERTKFYTVNFTLEDYEESLEEVIITAPKKAITIKKDTISYNLSSYLSGEEVKVKDILKKLPGITVNEDSGAIKFKGKEIEALLLGGDDLFGSNYTLGSKNINASVIAQVQAIENYSENALLKVIEDGEKVAINLVLKKGKFDFSGNIDTGLGFFEDLDLAHFTNATLLGVTKGYKSFATIGSNNLGTNNSPFDHFSSQKNTEQLREVDYFAEKVIPTTRFSNFLSDNRVNINNQLFGNYNAIFKVNKKIDLKTNLYYLSDHLKNNQFIENNFDFENERFTTIDSISYSNKPRQYRGDLELKYKTSNTALLTYNFRARQEDGRSASDIRSNNNNNNSFKTILNSDDFFILNELNYIKRLSGKKAIQFLVYQSSNKIDQGYGITPSFLSDSDFNLQNVTLDKKRLGGEVSLLGSSKNGSNYALFVKAKSIGHNLSSDLLDSTQDDINNLSQNDLNYSKKKIEQSGYYNFNFKRFRIIPEYSVGILQNNIENRAPLNDQNQTNLVLKNALKLRCKINRISFLQSSVSYETDNKIESYLFSNTILINNRTLLTNTPDLDVQETLSAGLLYYFYNLETENSLNVALNYNRSKNSFFVNSFIDQNTTRINYIFLPESQDDFSATVNGALFVPFADTFVEFNSNASIFNYKNLVNNSLLRDNVSKIAGLGVNLRTAFLSSLNFRNNFNFQYSDTKTSDGSLFINRSLRNSFSTLFKCNDAFFFKLTSDVFLPSFSNDNAFYNFIDFSVKYTPKGKKYSFELVSNNILNEINFEQVQVSDFGTNIQRTSLLPSYTFLAFSYAF